MDTLESFERAAAEGRLIVKVGRSWWAATITRVFHVEGGWIVRVKAGPGHGRGMITNIEDNAYGREFHII